MSTAEAVATVSIDLTTTVTVQEVKESGGTYWLARESYFSRGTTGKTKEEAVGRLKQMLTDKFEVKSWEDTSS